jgi:hypothetical protein
VVVLNQWPYCDSYAPKLKLIQDDKPKVKERLRKSTIKGVLALDQMQVRKQDIRKIED